MAAVGRYKQRTHDTHFQRDLPYLRNAQNPVQVVFLGDSHLERLLWFGDFKSKLPSNVMIAAVGGDRVENVLYRLEMKNDGILDHLVERMPETKKIVFMAGGNNGVHTEPKKKKSAMVGPVCEVVRHIIKLIRDRLPLVQLEIWGIPTDTEMSKDILYYNTRLNDICQEEKVVYSSAVFDATLEAVTDKKSIFEDLIHLNQLGYESCILPCVVKSSVVC